MNARSLAIKLVGIRSSWYSRKVRMSHIHPTVSGKYTPTIDNIQLLGNFILFRDGKRIDDKAWRSRQTRTILKILLLRPGAVVTTERLIEYLWPDENAPAARRRLYVRISDLRRVLPHPSPIQTVDGGYRFDINSGCQLDVVEFERWVESGRFHQEKNNLTEAIAAYKKADELYKGEFLAEDLYESWATAPRERLRELHLNSLTELAECYALQGRYRRAITLGQRVVALDPVREAMYVRLMLYHYYAGERTQALDVYERCQQLLAAELDVEPLPETIGMMQQIRDGAFWRNDDAPRYPPPIYQGRLFETPYSLGSPPLVGREREYAWLAKQLQEPHTQLVFLEAGCENHASKSGLEHRYYLRSDATRLYTPRGRLCIWSPLSIGTAVTF